MHGQPNIKVESINLNKLKAKSASCWSYYTAILRCTVNKTLSLSLDSEIRSEYTVTTGYTNIHQNSVMIILMLVTEQKKQTLILRYIKQGNVSKQNSY
jgi:hypothetical protein